MPLMVGVQPGNCAMPVFSDLAINVRVYEMIPGIWLQADAFMDKRLEAVVEDGGRVYYVKNHSKAGKARKKAVGTYEFVIPAAGELFNYAILRHSGKEKLETRKTKGKDDILLDRGHS
jgi:hypothetical protein